jgi:hypothetical protein
MDHWPLSAALRFWFSFVEYKIPKLTYAIALSYECKASELPSVDYAFLFVIPISTFVNGDLRRSQQIVGGTTELAHRTVMSLRKGMIMVASTHIY